MVAVKWSEPALDDLKEISQYISRDSPSRSKSFIDGIFEMAEHLSDFPNLGRRVPESDDPNVRVIIYSNYLIIYQIYEGYLEIVRVIHGRRSYRLN